MSSLANSTVRQQTCLSHRFVFCFLSSVVRRFPLFSTQVSLTLFQIRRGGLESGLTALEHAWTSAGILYTNDTVESLEIRTCCDVTHANMVDFSKKFKWVSFISNSL